MVTFLCMGQKVQDGSVLKPQGGAMLQRAAGCIFGAGNSGGDGAGVSKPVQLTFNSLYYLPQQYPEIAEIIQKCMKIDFEDYIIADPALIYIFGSKDRLSDFVKRRGWRNQQRDGRIV